QRVEVVPQRQFRLGRQWKLDDPRLGEDVAGDPRVKVAVLRNALAQLRGQAATCRDPRQLEAERLLRRVRNARWLQRAYGIGNDGDDAEAERFAGELRADRVLRRDVGGAGQQRNPDRV